MSDDTSKKPLRLYPVYFNEETLNNGPPMPENVRKFLLAMREIQLEERAKAELAATAEDSGSKTTDD